MKSDLKEDIADAQEIRRQKEDLKNSRDEMATWNSGRVEPTVKDDQRHVRD